MMPLKFFDAIGCLHFIMLAGCNIQRVIMIGSNEEPQSDSVQK